MRKLLISVIVLAASLGPICPLQWTAYAAPEPREALLMSVAGAEDLQTCAPQPGSGIGRKTSAKGCPTDRCLAGTEGTPVNQESALASKVAVKDPTATPASVAEHSPLSDVHQIVLRDGGWELAFNDTFLTVVKRE